MKTFAIAALTASLGAALFSASASAKVIQVDLWPSHNPSGQGGAWMSYDNVNQSFAFKYDNYTTRGTSDGFWLVVSDGPNPKNNVDEYAILYGDLTNNRLTAYAYDGVNGPNSYQDPNRFIASYENVFTTSGTNPMTMFSIDISPITSFLNTPDWDGISLDTGDYGLWFHETLGTQATYGADGKLESFGYDSQVWTDLAYKDPSWMGMWDSPTCPGGGRTGFADHCNVTPPETPPGGPAPAPGGLALVLLGLAGMRLRRRLR